MWSPWSPASSPVFFIAVVPEGAAEGTQGVVNFFANFKSLGDMITGSKGIGSVAATGVMFIFSILFFGILTDAGNLSPHHQGHSEPGRHRYPSKSASGTAILAAIVHLDGSGAVTFLICVPALLPLYDALGMRRTTLATIVALSAGTMNSLPWGGPTIRAHTALATMAGTEATVTGFFMPVLPAVLAGLVCVLVISAFLGAGEKKRIGTVALQAAGHAEQELTDEQKALLRPRLFWVNILLIVAAIVSLLFSGFAPAVVFMFFYVLATVIKLPQREGFQGPGGRPRQGGPYDVLRALCRRVLYRHHAGHRHDHRDGQHHWCPSSPIRLASSSPSSSASSVCPPPCSLIPTPSTMACSPCWRRPPRASASWEPTLAAPLSWGQMTVGFPVSPLTASTFLLVGLSGVDFGEHQKKTIPLAWLVSLVMVAVAILTRGIAI